MNPHCVRLLVPLERVMEMLGHKNVVRTLVFGGMMAECECGWLSEGGEHYYDAHCMWLEHVEDIKADTFPWRVRMETSSWEYGYPLPGDDLEFVYFESLLEAQEFVREVATDRLHSDQSFNVDHLGDGRVKVASFNGEVRVVTVLLIEDNIFEQVKDLLQPLGW